MTFIGSRGERVVTLCVKEEKVCSWDEGGKDGLDETQLVWIYH
jgi:hypothetical protein